MPQEIISWSDWKSFVTIKCCMWLRGKIVKSTEHSLGIQFQVSTFLYHSLGGQNGCFFQHDLAWVLLKSSFFFFCAALSTVLPTHQDFSALSFGIFWLPFSWWPLYINCLTSYWPDSPLNCSFGTADLSNIFNSWIISWVLYWHHFPFSAVNFIYSEYCLTKFKDLAFLLPSFFLSLYCTSLLFTAYLVPW